MTLNEIERALRDLRLSGIAATLNTRVMQAQSSQQPFLETLAAMLQDELGRRHSRLSERRFKHSRLEERLTLLDFDWRFNPKRRASIVVTSNRVVQDWGKYLGDATMGTTILDRLMHRAVMLEFEGKSYRLKEAAARIALNTTEVH